MLQTSQQILNGFQTGAVLHRDGHRCLVVEQGVFALEEGPGGFIILVDTNRGRPGSRDAMRLIAVVRIEGLPIPESSRI